MGRIFKRVNEDKVLRVKYDEFKEFDLKIIARVDEIAKNRGVNMAQIALVWQFVKGVDSPVLGAIKTEHLDDWVKALEELYVPHKVVGAISKGGPERIERK